MEQGAPARGAGSPSTSMGGAGGGAGGAGGGSRDGGARPTRSQQDDWSLLLELYDEGDGGAASGPGFYGLDGRAPSTGDAPRARGAASGDALWDDSVGCDLDALFARPAAEFDDTFGGAGSAGPPPYLRGAAAAGTTAVSAARRAQPGMRRVPSTQWLYSDNLFMDLGSGLPAPPGGAGTHSIMGYAGSAADAAADKAWLREFAGAPAEAAPRAAAARSQPHARAASGAGFSSSRPHAAAAVATATMQKRKWGASAPRSPAVPRLLPAAATPRMAPPAPALSRLPPQQQPAGDPVAMQARAAAAKELRAKRRAANRQKSEGRSVKPRPPPLPAHPVAPARMMPHPPPLQAPPHVAVPPPPLLPAAPKPPPQLLPLAPPPTWPAVAAAAAAVTIAATAPPAPALPVPALPAPALPVPALPLAVATLPHPHYAAAAAAAAGALMSSRAPIAADEAGLAELQSVVSKLDSQMRASIQESLFRLAASYRVRAAETAAAAAAGATAGAGDARPPVKRESEGAAAGSAQGGAAKWTSMIDESVATLLYHRYWVQDMEAGA